MSGAEDLKYEWWLAGVRSLSDEKKRTLRNRFGSGKEMYQRLYNIEEKHFFTLEFLKSREICLLRASARDWDPERRYEEGLRAGIRLILCHGKEYPERLKKLPGMPYALYVKGELPLEDSPTAAIVGARRCTPYGEEMAVAFAGKLAAAGVQIISGMACGIDGMAQRAALEAGGRSFGVLGSGVDVCYPKENRGLYADLARRGGVLSEQPVGAPPLREHFPARNRIISGLSDLVLVMEARVRSGSLITADLALEQGRDVYALPGPVTSSLSAGCHELIAQGAGILISPEKLLEELKISPEIRENEAEDDTGKNKKVLESGEKLVYASIGLFPKGVDTLLAETGMRPAELLRTLVALEMKGYIRELSRNYFIKAK